MTAVGRLAPGRLSRVASESGGRAGEWGLSGRARLTSWTFQALLVPTIICTAQFQMYQDLVLAAGWQLAGSHLICMAQGPQLCSTRITSRWNIAWQNESNRKSAAYRARADRAGGAAQRSLRRSRQLDWPGILAHGMPGMDVMD